MPVDSQHPAYAAMIDVWTRCRTAYAGEDAVKAAGVKYLPKVSPKQSTAGYDAYKTRASYYGAVGRTVDGFVGAIARKPNSYTLPEPMKVFETDATGDGVGLTELIKRLCLETLLQSRGGVLVEWDDAKARAYLVTYPAEAITNWGDDIGVVISETATVDDPADPFRPKVIDQFRQLVLADGVYTVRLWRKRDTGMDAGANQWFVFEETVPRNRGAALTEIPFFWLSSIGNTPRIEKPMLLDLVNVALSHYRTSADLEHGRHFTGLPTLYVTGSTDSDKPIEVGAATAIVLENPAAKVGYAEFTGQGLGSLETALETKKTEMATLGAAIFGQGRKGVEAAETARIRTAGENSLLMSIVSAVEETIEAALNAAAAWMQATGPLDVDINRDFIDTSLDALTVTALLGALQAGAISLETFLYNLQQGELLPPEMEIVAEAATLEARRQADKAAALAAQPKVPAAPNNARGVEA